MSSTCADCGRVFEHSGQGRPRKFCRDCSPSDPLAATRAWRRRTAERRKAERAAARATWSAKVCAECGQDFEAEQPHQLYCTRRCYKRAENRRARERYRRKRREEYERIHGPIRAAA